ncbi:Predicted DNA-binding protein, MmcQ/YjbR family [Pseudoxanthomonas sp. CF125]|nr:Predicted DNA-binding protein, MmcQ/YjbR family [Pseudoxanthomonas sp. CF125]
MSFGESHTDYVSLTPASFLMDTKQLKEFCAQLPGAASQLHDAPANILVYSVGGKRFAHFKTSQPEQWRFSIKVSPDRFLELTDVPGIKPARWLARFRWITIVDVASVPDDYLCELVQWSYRKALDSLSKARRAAILSSSY